MIFRKNYQSSSAASGASSKTLAISRTYEQHNSFKHIQNFVRDIELTSKKLRLHPINPLRFLFSSIVPGFTDNGAANQVEKVKKGENYAQHVMA